jgi:hypothetical protein
MVAKIKRVIVSLHAQCRNNTDRLSIFVADNQPPVLSAWTSAMQRRIQEK